MTWKAASVTGLNQEHFPVTILVVVNCCAARQNGKIIERP